ILRIVLQSHSPMTPDTLPTGRRLTRQRCLVYDTLAATTEHPDAERLIALVHRQDPSISVATAYNTLRLLVQADQRQPLHGRDPTTRYDANLHDHAHFTCRSCGKVEDIPAQHVGPPALRGDGLDGYRVDEVRVHALGWCADCAAQPDPTHS